VPSVATAYHLFSCTSWQPEVHLSIVWQTLNTTWTANVTALPGMTYNQNGLVITVPTLAIPPTPTLNSRFISNGRQMAAANDVQDDIHCSTYQDAATGQNCSLDTAVCRSCQLDGASGSNVICHCRSSPWPSYFTSDRAFPNTQDHLRLNGHGWSEVEAILHHLPVPLVIRAEDVRLASIVNDTVCYTDLLSLTGCYSCPTGALLTFCCRTDAGEALAQLECASFTLAIHCTTDESPINSTALVSVNKAHIAENCITRCPGGTTTSAISGHLHFLPAESPELDKFVAVPANSSGNGSTSPFSTSFFDFLKGFDPFGALQNLLAEIARIASLFLLLVAGLVVGLIFVKAGLLRHTRRKIATLLFIWCNFCTPLPAGIFFRWREGSYRLYETRKARSQRDWMENMVRELVELTGDGPPPNFSLFSPRQPLLGGREQARRATARRGHQTSTK
jgi:hypothetical protein